MGVAALKPQDLVVAFKLAHLGGRAWTIQEVARQVCLSGAEVSAALQRLQASRLFVKATLRQVVRPRLLEFLEHGLM